MATTIINEIDSGDWIEINARKEGTRVELHSLDDEGEDCLLLEVEDDSGGVIKIRLPWEAFDGATRIRRLIERPKG